MKTERHSYAPLFLDSPLRASNNTASCGVEKEGKYTLRETKQKKSRKNPITVEVPPLYLAASSFLE